MLLTKFRRWLISSNIFRKEILNTNSSLSLKNSQNLQNPFVTSFWFSTSSSEKTAPLSEFLKSTTTIQNLKKKEITSFFPIQVKTFNHIYSGKDVIAADKTGSGKTLAFSLPVIQKLRDTKELEKDGIKFMVLGPTRELVVQIRNQISSLSHGSMDFNVVACYGGQPIFKNLKALQAKTDVLVGTPGRIKDLIQRNVLQFQDVKVVCIDEADYMFDIGFQASIDFILKAIMKKSQNFQMLCFTATLNNGVVEIAKKYMQGDQIVITTKKQTATPANIKHYLIKTPYRRKIAIVRHIIQSKSNNGKVLIFTNTKIEGDELSKDLKIRNVLLHGDIEQSMRLDRLRLFRQGKVKVLIATDVASRGLDIPNVQVVINYSLPSQNQGYIHRSGRTGRAGKSGVCISLYNQSTVEQQTLLKISQFTSINFEPMEISMQELQETDKVKKQDYQFIKERSQNTMEEDRLSKNKQRSQVEREEKSFRKSFKYQKDQSNTNDCEPNSLILFDKKLKLNKQKVEKFLKDNGKQFIYVQQKISAKTNNKFFIIYFNSAKMTEETLKLKIYYDNQEYVKFQPKLKKKKQDFKSF